MRIFTPEKELPMAGHPTIGSTFALAIEGVIQKGRKDFVFELGVGPTPVSLEWGATGLEFAWMTQKAPAFGGVIEDRASAGKRNRSGFCRPRGRFAHSDVLVRPSFLFVPVKTRHALDAVTIDRQALARCSRDAGLDELPVFFFTTDRAGAGAATMYSRMLAPGFGIAEDPATGSASGPLGCYLVHHKVVAADAAHGLISLQGVAMGRPSRVHISIDSEGGTITRVRVGGQSVLVGRGEMVF
jgi:trans-2,3-dihydro-3-hydroxyanthranilate isomerase